MQQTTITHSPLIIVFLLAVATVVLLAGCTTEQESLAGQCGSCHTTAFDPAHQLACTVCHQGDSQTKDQTAAHATLIARPAHPDNLDATCGSCHQQEVREIHHAKHSTLSNLVNLVRNGFGADSPLPSLTDIPVNDLPENITQLADDLLRRRCLRCHLFSPGDNYSATVHGTGCAACHLSYRDGKLVAHDFSAPKDDERCLSCHYGNRVGFDYYGRFEHDYNTEYRTPYTAAATTSRPYGVEYHQLAPDIHQQRGLICIDCHSGKSLMQPDRAGQMVSCADCHDPARLAQNLIPGVTSGSAGYTFVSRKDGRQHPLPLLRHPAHTAYSDVSCQACHAQWSFNDTGTHLLRSDLDEYDSWARLTVQGSSDVEQLLEHNLDFGKDELPPTATDTITNEKRLGIWYKGYIMRRWETIVLGRTADGRVSVMRPQLDLSLSWIDEEENVRFDSFKATAGDNGMLPYTPHTTGPAGLFYEERLLEYRRTERENTMQAD